MAAPPRSDDDALPVEDLAGAIAAATALVDRARRGLWIFSRALDPGLLDAAPVQEALRRFAIGRGDKQVAILLQDAATPPRMRSPLLGLAQRLPSVFAFRQTQDPLDTGRPYAYLANDTGGYCFRPLGQRWEGEVRLDDRGRAQRWIDEFEQAWERSRPCHEFRALEL